MTSTVLRRCPRIVSCVAQSFNALVQSSLRLLQHDRRTCDGSLVLGIVAHVLALEKHVDLSEGGSLQLITIPTLPHQVVNLLGAEGRAGEEHLAGVVMQVVSAVVNHLVVV